MKKKRRKEKRKMEITMNFERKTTMNVVIFISLLKMSFVFTKGIG